MRFLILLFIVIGHQANAQVLISLLLGDKLNSDKLEFGLDGGMSVSNIRGRNEGSNLRALNLGFYFDFRLKNPTWYIHTGVMVKSSMGSKELPVYTLNNPDLDAAFAGGSVTRKLAYFNVPVLVKHRFANNFFVEAGPMISLLAKATDQFITSVQSSNDLQYKLKIRDQFHPLDAGVLAGVGYRLLGGNGMNLGIRYYHGLTDVLVDDAGAGNFNQAFYFSVGIPIGAGKVPKKE